MTLLEKLKSLNGKTVTIRDWFCNQPIEKTGILSAERSAVYPHTAFLQLSGYTGGYFAGLDTIVIEGKENLIILNKPS